MNQLIPTKRQYKIISFLLYFCFAWIPLNSVFVQAEELPAAKPEDTGMAPDRILRLDSFINKYVQENQIAGAVSLIVRQSSIIHLKAYGMQDKEQNIPMKTDTLFRIASMSKPITSAAAMTLFEEGKFLLEDPVSKFIPEFKEMKILVPKANGYDLVPASKPITIRQIMTHTSGITYEFMGRPYLKDMYKEAKISNGLYPTEGTIGDMVKHLAKLPLYFQPGEKMEYGQNTDVLGYLIEVLSGMPLNKFIEERLFKPLDMTDTSFFISDEKKSRLASVYEPDGKGGIQKFPEKIVNKENVTYSSIYPYTSPKTYFSGGGGLISTARDYSRFLQMILNGGTLEENQILSRKTVELMQQNLIGNLEPSFQGGGFGFGLGFAIHMDQGVSGKIITPGTLGWGGFFSTTFFVDPDEDIIAILLTQKYPGGGMDLLEKFPVLVYQAIKD